MTIREPKAVEDGIPGWEPSRSTGRAVLSRRRTASLRTGGLSGDPAGNVGKEGLGGEQVLALACPLDCEAWHLLAARQTGPFQGR
jgi:hypothetical protein